MNTRKYKLEVAAYVSTLDAHPVLCVIVSVPPNGKMGQFASPVVRRNELGYMDLYNACNGNPRWLYGQLPSPLL